MLSGLNSIRQFVTGPALIAVFDAPWLPIYTIATFLFHPWLGVFTVVGSLILTALAVWNEMTTRKSMSEANRLSVSSSSYVNSTLQNACCRPCSDRRVPLYLQAEVELEALYTEGYLAFPFRRTLSRLHEMQLQRFG